MVPDSASAAGVYLSAQTIDSAATLVLTCPTAFSLGNGGVRVLSHIMDSLSQLTSVIDSAATIKKLM